MAFFGRSAVSSAETGNDTVMKTHFKEFDEALKQLEEQMKKP
jgi:hypothetical protein